MTYYMETARPAMRNAATLMGELADSYTTEVQGATEAMGQIGWPLMMFFCAEPYNESLRWARDAAVDTGEGVSSISAALTQIVEIYDRLEQANLVR